MASLIPLGIGLGSKLLGGLFGNKSKNKAQQADFQNQQAMLDYQAALRNQQFDTDEQRRVLRGSMFKGLAQALGLGNLIPSGYTGFSTSLRQGVQAPRLQNGGTGTSFMGDIFNSAGSALIGKYLQDSYEGAYGGGQQPGGSWVSNWRSPSAGQSDVSLPTNQYVTGQIGQGFSSNDEQGF